MNMWAAEVDQDPPVIWFCFQRFFLSILHLPSDFLMLVGCFCTLTLLLMLVVFVIDLCLFALERTCLCVC